MLVPGTTMEWEASPCSVNDRWWTEVFIAMRLVAVGAVVAMAGEHSLALLLFRRFRFVPRYRGVWNLLSPIHWVKGGAHLCSYVQCSIASIQVAVTGQNAMNWFRMKLHVPSVYRWWYTPPTTGKRNQTTLQWSWSQIYSVQVWAACLVMFEVQWTLTYLDVLVKNPDMWKSKCTTVQAGKLPSCYYGTIV